MIELLLVPAAGLTVALFGEKFKSKIEENKVEYFHDLITKNEQEIGKKKKENKVF